MLQAASRCGVGYLPPGVRWPEACLVIVEERKRNQPRPKGRGFVETDVEHEACEFRERTANDHEGQSYAGFVRHPNRECFIQNVSGGASSPP